jgi:hypothetical protein
MLAPVRPERAGTVVMCALLLSLAAGCGSSPRSSNTGTVTGVLQAVGGLAPAPRPLSGTVTITDRQVTVTAITKSNGTFSARVPAGSYGVTGRSPAYESGMSDCIIENLAKVDVAEGRTAAVTVNCEEM